MISTKSPQQGDHYGKLLEDFWDGFTNGLKKHLSKSAEGKTTLGITSQVMIDPFLPSIPSHHSTSTPLHSVDHNIPFSLHHTLHISTPLHRIPFRHSKTNPH